MPDDTTEFSPSHLTTGDESRTDYFQLQDGDRVRRLSKFNLAYPKWMIPRSRRPAQIRLQGAPTHCGWLVAYGDALEGLVLDVVLRDGWQWDEPAPLEEVQRRGLTGVQSRCDLLVRDVANALMGSWKMKCCEVLVRFTPLENQRHYFEGLLPRGSV